ncbi:MAG: radical SAM protein [Pseudomonadota bacterium]
MRVVLVGEQFEGTENLALHTLQTALEAGGHEVARVSLGTLFQIEKTARAVLAKAPYLIGISIGYQVSALTAMSLGHFLRQLGYKGHMTAGGAFATLHAKEILRDCPLDSIILFEGEKPLAMLADCLASGQGKICDVPGILFRTVDGIHEGPAARVWEEPFDFWPARDLNLPEHLGIPGAAMLGSRGCNRKCSYCCISALGDAAQEHASLAGCSESYVQGTKRRDPKDIAEEIASINKQHNARIFRFEDDCLLGSSEIGSLRFIRDLQHELGKRRIKDIGLTIKLRPDSVTPATASALRRLGVMHAFVGIEAMTDSTLSQLGRKYSVQTCHTALSALEQNGIPAYFNALIIGPDATEKSLEQDIQALAGIEAFPFEIATIILYQGTPMFEALAVQNRVHGNYLSWRYDFLENKVEAVARILSRIPTRRTGAYGPAKQLADLGFNLAIAQRFYPDVHIGHLQKDLAELIKETNKNTLDLMQRILVEARTAPSLQEQLSVAKELGAKVYASDMDCAERIQDLLSELESAIFAKQGVRRPRSFLRSGVAAAAISAQLIFAACSDSQPPVDTGPVVQDFGGKDMVVEKSNPLDDSQPDSFPGDSVPDIATDSDSAIQPDISGSCDETITEDESPWLAKYSVSGCVTFTRACEERKMVFAINGAGKVTNVTGDVSAQEKSCIMAAVANVCFPKVAGTNVDVMVFGPCD